MPQDDGPWKHSKPPRVSRLGLYLWIGLVGGAVLLVWYLHRLFPGVAQSDWDSASIIEMVAILAFVSSGLIYARQINLGEAARNLALWGMIAAVLLVAYSFKDSLQERTARIRSALVPGAPVQTGPRTLILTAGESGNFFVYGRVNGARVRFVVDTGASDIVLSPDDARRAGINLADLSFDKLYETANGAGYGAAVTLDSLTIGPIRETGVRASVNKAPMSSSLLGMAFLKSLKSFEVSKDRLVLHW